MDFLATPHLWILYSTPSVSERFDAAGLRLFLLTKQPGLIGVSAIALLFLLSVQGQAYTFPDAGTAYVSPPAGYHLNIRSGPGIQYQAVNTFRRGTPITLTGFYENRWAQLTDNSWVAGNLINSLPPNVNTTLSYLAYVSTPVGYNLNSRSGPGIQYPAVNTLRHRTPLTTTGLYENGWVQLTDGNWVASNWIQVGQPVTQEQPAPPQSTPSGYLQRGSQGVLVTELQRRLQVLGYLPGEFTPNNVFGERTEQAVRRFQQRNNLPIDGVVGPQTVTVLYSDTANVNAPDSAAGISQPDTSASPTPIPSTPAPPTPVPPTSVPSTEAPSDQTSVQEATVATDDGMDALIFSGPGTDSDLLGFIPNGSSVKITGRFEGSWAELENGNWVYTDWLDF